MFIASPFFIRCKVLAEKPCLKIRLYSVILAYNFAEYLVNEVTKLGYTDYSIGIVCPFRAQSDAIRGMLESRPIDNLNCTIQCGTVHKFQGSECDSMIVIMNTPLEVTSGSHVNDPNLVNVAISRAKDYLFIMTPDHSVNKFWTREALGKIASNKSNNSALSNSLVQRVRMHSCNRLKKSKSSFTLFTVNNSG